MLSLKECLVLRASYNRSNLFYEVRLKSGTHKTQMDTMVALIKRRFAADSGEILQSRVERNDQYCFLHAGIVYCFSRKDTELVASGLCEKGIKAAHYHADVSPSLRSKVHMKWLDNTIQVSSYKYLHLAGVGCLTFYPIRVSSMPPPPRGGL